METAPANEALREAAQRALAQSDAPIIIDDSDADGLF
jgi:hypothetical protein